MTRYNRYVGSLIILTIFLVWIGCEDKIVDTDDTTPPTVAITSPANEALVSEPVTIKASATDDKGVAYISFFVDGDSLGTDDTEPFEQYWNVGYWADGNVHSILAKAADEAGNTGQSDVVSVTVSEDASLVPELVSPEQGAVFYTDSVKFVWRSIPQTATYALELAPDSQFADIQFSTNITDTSVIVTDLELRNYYWRVRAQNQRGQWTDWSETRDISVFNLVPELVSPEQGAAIYTDSVTFVWRSIPGAVTYALELASNEQFTDIQFSANITDTSVTVVDLEFRNYCWRVRVQNQREQWTSWSETRWIIVSSWWSRTFGGSEADYGYSVQQTTDGGFILTGVTSSYGAGESDVWLLKTDASGTEEWNKTFGGSDRDAGRSVQQTLDGGFILTGVTSSYGAGSYDIWLLKTDASGTEEWSQTYGGSEADYGNSVQQTADGGFILTGVTSSYGAGSYDIWLLKTDASGTEEWSQTFGGSTLDGGYSVQQTADGGFILTGETSSYGAGESDVWLIKTDASGTEEWSQTYGGGGGGYSVQQTLDGGFIMTGDSSYYVGCNVWLLKTDASGTREWSQTFGGSSRDGGESVQQTADGGFIITGYTHSYGAGKTDVLLIKTDEEGNAPRLE